MANQKQIYDLIKSMSGQANIIAIPRIYIDLLEGDINAAVLLSQIVYWSDKTKRPDGWFYKSVAEWQMETGLTNYKIKRAEKLLEEIGFIQTKLKRANGAPTTHYFLDFEFLTNSIIKFLENQETNKSDYQETAKSDLQETDESLTEITQEITQEINNISPKIFEPEIEIYREVTGLVPDCGNYDKVIIDIQSAFKIRQMGTEQFITYLRGVYHNWKGTRTKDGRPYSPSNPKWIEWAITGRYLEDKPATKQGKEKGFYA